MVQTFDSYRPPEMQSGHMNGIVYGHPRFHDVKRVVTSALVEMDIPNGRAKTRSLVTGILLVSQK